MANSTFVKLVDSKNHNVKWMSRLMFVKKLIVSDDLTSLKKGSSLINKPIYADFSTLELGRQ